MRSTTKRQFQFLALLGALAEHNLQSFPLGKHEPDNCCWKFPSAHIISQAIFFSLDNLQKHQFGFRANNMQLNCIKFIECIIKFMFRMTPHESVPRFSAGEREGERVERKLLSVFDFRRIER